MIYKKFQDIKLSALGLGGMRLPCIDSDDSRIDEAAAAQMIDYAVKNGVNYFDTAWGYHSGNSETVMGKALSAYPRDKFYLATKFPGYDLSNMGKTEEIFTEQLKKCRVDYFDFYLFHNVCEMNIDAYLDESYGTFAYLYEQKKNGRIRHLGFSAHGSVDTMRRFLNKYGKYMEFCQIQLNYIDRSFQDGEEKVKLLNEWNIPVWVMEPLRGGKLAKLAPEDEEKLKRLRPDEDIPAWAFRYLQTFDSVTVTLSGMSNFDQLKANIGTFSSEKPLLPMEQLVLLSIAHKMIHSAGVPCTACHYCVSHCPQGLDIPGLLSLYNEHAFTGGGFLAPMALMALPDDKKPSACIGCRSCEKVCPQNIKISEVMSDFSERLK